MTKLGYTSPYSELDSFKAECFSIISSEIDKEKAAESKKKRGKKHGK